MMSERTTQELIEAAADVHDVDLDTAVTAADPDPESSRIYILEEAPRGYRLIEFGLEAGYPEEGRPASEEPMFIPESAVGAVQGLLHSAGLHQAHDSLIDGSTRLRDVSEEMGVSEPLQPDGGDR
jgi:hypothetical protein